MPTFFAGQTDYIEKLNDVDAAAGAAQDDIDAHIADTTAAHAASAISNTPAGGIAATTVQAAINELDTEKLSASATTLPSSFVNASLNSITPTGGVLAVTGNVSATGSLQAGAGGDGALSSVRSDNTSAIASGVNLSRGNATGTNVNISTTGDGANGVAAALLRFDGTEVMRWQPGNVAVTGAINATGILRTDLSASGNALVLAGTSASNMIVALGSSGLPTRIYNTNAGGFAFRDSGDAADVLAISNSGVSVTGSISATGRINNSTSLSEDNSAVLVNVSATGYGLYSKGGSASRYAAAFCDKDDTLILLARTGAVEVTGSISATSLVDISAAGAGQIKFPATQNASADANTLDDHERGDWSATLASSGGGTVTLNGTAKYTKNGNAVCVYLETFNVDISSLSAGDLSITGLPFVCSAASPAIAYFDIAGAASAGQGSVVAYASNSATAQLLRSESTAATLTALTKADLNSNVSIRFNGSYRV